MAMSTKILTLYHDKLSHHSNMWTYKPNIVSIILKTSDCNASEPMADGWLHKKITAFVHSNTRSCCSGTNYDQYSQRRTQSVLAASFGAIRNPIWQSLTRYNSPHWRPTLLPEHILLSIPLITTWMNHICSSH